MEKISVLRKNLKDAQDKLELALEKVYNSKTRQEAQKEVFATRVKHYRSENRLTQRELAEKLGIGILSVIRWEGKASMPCKSAMKKLIKAGIIEGK